MHRGTPAGPPGKLRIVAGRLRGSRLVVPDKAGLRPTSDRVRETLFNWLAPFIDGARCLDLYAGTGALGIEALSRGAASATFVESDRALAKLLAENLARLKVENARIVESDALSYLKGRAEPFDVAFVDPPFGADLWNESARRLDEGGWLAPAALVYVESPADAELALPPGWMLHRAGRAGAVRFALYRRAAADPLS
ncbi:MAG TPA: 16S rRNA (guanine(966)-N(2))-methyltransferase RsmD [Rhodanobacteraceae bacterium]|nr:16S rRNA (guanine(966)-N(2))-methyltransferase RsmD [Rhodanobacteraceae bacterium]